MAWILFENTLLYVNKMGKSSAADKSSREHVTLENDDRNLQLSDARIPLIFVSMFLCLLKLSDNKAIVVVVLNSFGSTVSIFVTLAIKIS